MRVYIAGPMTGLPDFNYPAFNAAAAAWRALGHWVENPAEWGGGDTTQPYNEYLRSGFAEVLKCDAIAVLPGWNRSHGARREVAIAIWLGVEIFDAVTRTHLPRIVSDVTLWSEGIPL